MRVEDKYVRDVNANSETSGKMFIIDEGKTTEWLKENEADAEAKKNAEAKRKLGVTEEVEALIEKGKDKKPRKRRTKAEIEADKDSE